MADVAHAASAAKRRRERRLRAMLRHERRSVAMALAEFTHHSSRGQRTARAWEEVEVENATHDGLRAQKKTPPPGERHRAALGGGSSFTVAAVAGRCGGAFLLKVALQLKKDEEEEARKVEMEQVQAVKEQWRARRKVLKDEFMALLDLESRSSLQERRLQELLDALDAHDASKPSSGSSKRRKRKLPKAPLDVPVLFSDKSQQFFEFFLPQVQFLDRMVDIPVVQQRQVPTVFFTYLVQFLGKVLLRLSCLTCPSLCNDRCSCFR